VSIFEPPVRDNIYDENNSMLRDWWLWFQEVWLDVVLNNAFRLRSTVNIDNSNSPYTLVNTVRNLVCDTTSGAITVNYAAGIHNTIHRVTNIGTAGNDVTLNAASGEEIRGLSSQTLYDEETLKTTFSTTKFWW